MSLTKVTYSMINGAPINVRDFGAVGDGVTDDTTAIQAAFDLAYASVGVNYAATRIGAANAKTIFLPPGTYRVTDALILGEVGKTVYNVTLQMDGACIVSEYSGASPALTLQYPTNCVFYGLSVFTAEAITGIKINNSKGCAYYNTKASASGLASIHLTGMQFNNTWENISFNQNVGGAGSDWCWYWDCNPANVIAPAVFAGGPINKISGMFMANAVNSMYWNYASDVNISVIEHEGFAGSVGDGVAQFFNCAEMTLSNIYQEAFPNPANSLYFENCNFLDLSNFRSGSYYHYTKFKDCTNVSIRNYYIGAIKYEGTNTDFDFTNCKFFTAATRNILTQDSVGYFKRLQMRNVFVRNQINTVDVGQIPLLSTGNLSQADNWLANPRGLDSVGGIITTNCATTDDPLYQSVSPLGFIETLVTIDSASGFPQIIPNLTTANFAGAKTSKAVALVAWKVDNLPAGITSATQENGTVTFGKPYGDLNLRVGDWALSWALIDVDATATNISFVWNYASSFAIGTKFLFVGAIVYGGSDIRFPVI